MSSVGGGEANEYVIKKDDKFRPLYLADRPGAARPESTYNMMLRHGVRSCFEYAKSFDRAKALALSNPDLAPHLKFVDIGGHGYATVRLTGDEMRTEFVCIPRPITRGGHARRWPAPLSRCPQREAVGAGRTAEAGPESAGGRSRPVDLGGGRLNDW